MFEKMNFMSIMDMVQMSPKIVGFFSNLFGGKISGKKSTIGSGQTAEAKSDENLPTGLLSEKFTKVDESYWQTLMPLLDDTTRWSVRNLTERMKILDDADHGSRVDSFRIGVLLMPNKLVEEDAPQTNQQANKQPRRRQTQQVDPRFTGKDSRIIYLKYVSDLISIEMPLRESKEEAIDAVIKYLENDGFLTTGYWLTKSKELAEKTAGEVYEEILRFRLGEEYEAIGSSHPQASPESLRELRLCALRVRENYRKQALLTKEGKKLTQRDMVVIAVPSILLIAVIIYGFIVTV